MLFSPTRPVTPESRWVPGRLPRPTRQVFPSPYTQVLLYGNTFVFPSPYTQVLLYGNKFFFPSPYTQVLLYGSRFFFLRHIHKCSSFHPFFFHFAHGSLKKLSLRR